MVHKWYFSCQLGDSIYIYIYIYHRSHLFDGNNRNNHWKTQTRWWFQILFFFTPTWGRFTSWLIFFKWVETCFLQLLGCFCCWKLLGSKGELGSVVFFFHPFRKTVVANIPKNTGLFNRDPYFMVYEIIPHFCWGPITPIYDWIRGPLCRWIFSHWSIDPSFQRNIQLLLLAKERALWPVFNGHESPWNYEDSLHWQESLSNHLNR